MDSTKAPWWHTTGLRLQDFLRTVDSTTSPSAAATVGSVWKMKRDGLGQDERASAGVTEKQPVELAYVGSQFTDGQDRDGLSYGELAIEE